ncbi:MAG TPA: hypothetical protein VMW10_08600 [Alphaproteobacteria bacterium]|nr:hypothetical protein [Alphaproteobacteria bacterium]
MWFKKKKHEGVSEAKHEVLREEVARHCTEIERLKLASSAVCDRCGKTDFKANMELVEEAIISKRCSYSKREINIICPGRDIYSLISQCNRCHHYETYAKKKTTYKHKSCRKPKTAK